MTDVPGVAPAGAALVTGGGKRIGRAIVLTLARAGHDVAIHYGTSAEEAAAVAAEVEALGRRAVAIGADLTDETAVRGVVPDAVKALGPLGVLVNCASAFQDDRVGALSRDSWDRHMETNLRAPIVLSEAFAAQAPDGGAIVNILDERVLKPDPRFFSYALSRAGLAWATRTMAQAMAPRIRVNGVAPGPTLRSVHQSEAEFEAEWKAIPLQRQGGPEVVADAVLWLTRAPMTTGHILTVDGGQHLAWRTPDILDAD